MGEFDLQFDGSTGIATLVKSGAWDQETLNRWELALRDLVAARGNRPGGLRILVDLRNFSVLSQDIAQRMRMISGTLANDFERVAIISPETALATLQTRRLASVEGKGDGRERVFAAAECDQAQAWLAE